jgi:tetratricopeptide (TPR) repeat protein
MKSGLFKLFVAVGVAALFSAQGFAADTNSISTTNVDATANGILQLQAQLHSTQLQIEESREEAAAAARSNIDLLNSRIQSLEQSLAAQRASDADATHKMQQFMLLLAGGFGLVGLGILLMMAYFQWRAFSQLAEISAHQGMVLAAGEGVHRLAAPGRAAVEVSNARLLDVVGRLEKRIVELESGGKLLAEPAIKSANPLADGQKFLEANEPRLALECFDALLATQPHNAEALVKKAAALEKLDRVDEALAFCDRAIAANGGMVGAYLHKGGLLNRLARYEEALQCYEQAMLVQDKKH